MQKLAAEMGFNLPSSVGPIAELVLIKQLS